jgi:hypothetical protein
MLPQSHISHRLNRRPVVQNRPIPTTVRPVARKLSIKPGIQLTIPIVRDPHLITKSRFNRAVFGRACGAAKWEVGGTVRASPTVRERVRLNSDMILTRSQNDKFHSITWHLSTARGYHTITLTVQRGSAMS